MQIISGKRQKERRRGAVLLCPLVAFCMIFSASGSWQPLPSADSNCLGEQAKSICCCATAAGECQCVDCACHQNGPPVPKQPALPPTEKTEIVFSLDLQFEGFCCLPKRESKKPKPRRKFLTITSAREACAVLSRFRC